MYRESDERKNLFYLIIELPAFGLFISLLQRKMRLYYLFKCDAIECYPLRFEFQHKTHIFQAKCLRKQYISMISECTY